MQIIPFLDNLTTSGAVNISLNVTEDVKQIVLNAYDLEINSESVEVRKSSDGTEVEIDHQEYNNISQTYTITLNSKLEEGVQYELGLNFTGLLGEKMQGFYSSNYFDTKTDTER